MVLTAADAQLAREALHACPLFAGLDHPALDACVASLRDRRFRRGEVIFHLGDPGDSLFVIVSGSVKVLLPPDDGSEPAILTTLGPGAFFGELALLDGAPRSATVVAVDAVRTLVLRREPFSALLDVDPGMRQALLAALAGEVRRLTAQIEDLHFLDLPGRLANHILRRISETEPSDGEARLAWPFTQAELAAMIGGSRQSVNRLLADLEARGVLRFDGATLVVPDRERLAEAAHR